MDHPPDRGSPPLLDRPLNSATHLPALDGLRGIAVLLVMFFHFGFSLNAHDSSFFSKLVYKTTHWGWCGVDLFFVLSGFLITGILLDSRSSPAYFRTFYIRRTLRIFPLYYGVLVVCFLLIPLLRPYRSPADQAVVGHQLSLWFYCSNIAASIQGWVHDGRWLAMDHFWSLALEEQFYLAWPLIVALSSRRTLAMVCAACILLAPAARVWFIYFLHDDVPPYVLMPCRMDPLAWGGLVALATRSPEGIASLVLRARWAVVGCSLVIGGILIKYRYFATQLDIVGSLGFSVVALLWASVLILAVAAPRGSPLGMICWTAPLQATGRIAYGLYVFHYMLNPFGTRGLAWAREKLGTLPAATLYLAGMLVSSYAVSLASWHFYEKVFRRMKDRLSPHRAAV